MVMKGSLDDINQSKNIHHRCFFIVSVDKSDSIEVEKKQIEHFYQMIDLYPDNWGELVNKKNGEHLVYNKQHVIDVGPSRSKKTMDIDAFIKSISILKGKVKIKKKDFSYIYKGVKEKLFGEGFEKMSPEVFCTILYKKGLSVGKKSNIYKYSLEGDFPNWHTQDGSILESQRAVSIVSQLLDIYHELINNPSEN